MRGRAAFAARPFRLRLPVGNPPVRGPAGPSFDQIAIPPPAASDPCASGDETGPASFRNPKLLAD
jgi:hypothetical protein